MAIDDHVTDIHFKDGKILSFIKGRKAMIWGNLSKDYGRSDRIFIPFCKWLPAIGLGNAAITLASFDAPERYLFGAASIAIAAIGMWAGREKRREYNAFFSRFGNGRPWLPSGLEESRALHDAFPQYVTSTLLYDPTSRLNQS